MELRSSASATTGMPHAIASSNDKAERRPAKRVQVNAALRPISPCSSCIARSRDVPMPKRSSGAASRSKRGKRSVPVTRLRRCASLITTAMRSSSPVYRYPGSGMPCSISRVAGRARIPKQCVEMRDVNERQIIAVGERMAHLVDAPLRCVVFEIDDGTSTIGLRPPKPTIATSPSSSGRCNTTTSTSSPRGSWSGARSRTFAGQPARFRLLRRFDSIGSNSDAHRARTRRATSRGRANQDASVDRAPRT